MPKESIRQVIFAIFSPPLHIRRKAQRLGAVIPDVRILKTDWLFILQQPFLYIRTPGNARPFSKKPAPLDEFFLVLSIIIITRPFLRNLWI